MGFAGVAGDGTLRTVGGERGVMVESRSKSPAGIVAVVGGLLLVIGSVLPWAKVSFDVDAFASLLKVDPSVIQDAALSQSIGGPDGTLTLIAGILVLVCAAIFLAKRANTALGVLILLGGLAGAGIALYDIMSKDRQLDDALAEAGPTLQSAGVSLDAFKQVFDVSFSIGIYVCVVGGILALIGGVMALRIRSEPPAAAADPGSTIGSGFAAPTSTPTAPAPPASPIPSTPPPPPPSGTSEPSP
jgi:hypothetical protein